MSLIFKRNLLKERKLPINESVYLMGTAEVYKNKVYVILYVDLKHVSFISLHVIRACIVMHLFPLELGSSLALIV